MDYKVAKKLLYFLTTKEERLDRNINQFSSYRTTLMAGPRD